MQCYLHLWEDEGQIRRRYFPVRGVGYNRRLCVIFFAPRQHATEISSGAAEASALGAKTRDHEKFADAEPCMRSLAAKSSPVVR